MQLDPELRQVSRLHRELVEAARLLKFCQRVEDAKSVTELQKRFQALAALEGEALADRQMQKQQNSEVQKLTEQRTKLMQVSASLQEINKALQVKLDLAQKEHAQFELEVANIRLALLVASLTCEHLKKELEVITKGKSDAEGLCGQLKKSLEAANVQMERDRTQWAREQQLHRTQEQKLISLVQQADRAKSASETQTSEVAGELTALKSRLSDALSALQQLDSLKTSLASKDTQIAALERKCLRYERELKLKEDEQDL